MASMCTPLRTQGCCRIERANRDGGFVVGEGCKGGFSTFLKYVYLFLGTTNFTWNSEHRSSALAFASYGVYLGWMACFVTTVEGWWSTGKIIWRNENKRWSHFQPPHLYRLPYIWTFLDKKVVTDPSLVFTYKASQAMLSIIYLAEHTMYAHSRAALHQNQLSTP